VRCGSTEVRLEVALVVGLEANLGKWQLGSAVGLQDRLVDHVLYLSLDLAIVSVAAVVVGTLDPSQYDKLSSLTPFV